MYSSLIFAIKWFYTNYGVLTLISFASQNIIDGYIFIAKYTRGPRVLMVTWVSPHKSGVWGFINIQGL